MWFRCLQRPSATKTQGKSWHIAKSRPPSLGRALGAATWKAVLGQHGSGEEGYLFRKVGFGLQQPVSSSRFNKADLSTSIQPSVQSENCILILLCSYSYSYSQDEVSWIYCSLRVTQTLGDGIILSFLMRSFIVHNFSAVIPSEDEYTSVDFGI